MKGLQTHSFKTIELPRVRMEKPVDIRVLAATMQ